MDHSILGIRILIAFSGAWFSILFIQSGFDKVFDWKGNLGWISKQFSKSFLGPMTPMLLLGITVLECAAGLISLGGLGYFLFTWDVKILFWGIVLSNLDFVMLFFGQRFSKEYVGAASLQGYFAVGILSLLGCIIYLTMHAVPLH